MTYRNICNICNSIREGTCNFLNIEIHPSGTSGTSGTSQRLTQGKATEEILFTKVHQMEERVQSAFARERELAERLERAKKEIQVLMEEVEEARDRDWENYRVIATLEEKVSILILTLVLGITFAMVSGFYLGKLSIA